MELKTEMQKAVNNLLLLLEAHGIVREDVMNHARKTLANSYKGHSISTWVCDDCPEEIIQTTTYSDIACVGVPICRECGEDMAFMDEEWIEEAL